MAKTPPEKRVLNKQQREAVEYGNGPLLIIAGAGTGKTTVVTERIKHLISKNIAKPQEILALTFTEKAAREMEERVDQIVPYGYTQMWISTFHAFCDRVLRDEATHMGFDPSFRLMSDVDATMLLRKSLFSFDLDYFRPLGNPTKFITGLLQHFSRLRDEDTAPSQYIDWVNGQFSIFNDQAEERKLELQKFKELARVYEQYEKLKIKEGVMDFSDLVANTLKLFRTRRNILKRYQNKFRFLLIDEFQDTNIAQNELVFLLSGSQQNLTVVADDDQAIYRWRGAAVSNVIKFRKNFPKAHLIVLYQNYRSSQEILDRSYQLIQHNNPDRLEVKEKIKKKLAAVRKTKNVPVAFFRCDRVENEAEKVGKEIQRLVANKENYSWKDVAILVRANNHADVFLRTFTRMGIPYQFLGPGQLFRQPEVKDLIAYLQVLENFEDSVSLFKVLSMQYFDLSVRDLVAINNFSKRYNISLFEGCEIALDKQKLKNARLPTIRKKTKEKLGTIINMIERHLKRINRETAGQLLYYFLQDTGMIKNILNYKFPIDEHKANNISKFFSKLKTYEAEHEDASVQIVLDWILLAMELGESPRATDTDWTENDAVNILTVHSSKGLEFPVVFLVNLVSQRFPTRQRREQIPIPVDFIKEELPEDDYHMQEERRLFYVGATRARDRLYLTAANYYGEGKREKKMSPFIVEMLGEEILQQKLVEHDAQLPLFEWKKDTSKPDSAKNQSAPGGNQLTSKHSISYLSYSQINTFQICPLHYKLQYLLKIPSAPSASLSFGSSIHDTLKDFFQNLKDGKKVKKDTLLKLLEENWIPVGYRSKKHEQKFRNQGEQYLSDYFAKHKPFTKPPILIEQNFIVPIRNDKRLLKIRGRIDRVDALTDGKIEIIDYKTGKPKKQKDIDKSLQLSMYALAATEIAAELFNKKPDEIILSMYFFDNQEKISTTRTVEQLEKEKEKILAIADEIEQSDFKCSGNILCKRCEYQMFCGVG